MYTLLVISPCSPRIQGKTRYLLAGDILRLTIEQAQQLINGPLGRKFKVTHIDEDSKPEVKSEPTPVQTTAVEFADGGVVNNLIAETVSNEESSDYKEIPLEPNAHWSKVKNYVLELEEQYPVDLKLIAEIKARYPEYKAVVKECDRILETYKA